MGGRGASSGNTISKLQSKFNKIKKKNTKLYKEYNGFEITGDLKKLTKRNIAYKEWLKNSKELAVLNQKINSLK
jgi:hypothetical protein